MSRLAFRKLAICKLAICKLVVSREARLGLRSENGIGIGIGMRRGA